jgi:hypothetical protein
MFNYICPQFLFILNKNILVVKLANSSIYQSRKFNTTINHERQ